jgi:hypothetical protein
MATTTLKLPEDLKRRLKRLAVTARKDPHAFMIEVLAREAERLERRERFAPDCMQSEKETLASGQKPWQVARLSTWPLRLTIWPRVYPAEGPAAPEHAHGALRSNGAALAALKRSVGT